MGHSEGRCRPRDRPLERSPGSRVPAPRSSVKVALTLTVPARRPARQPWDPPVAPRVPGRRRTGGPRVERACSPWEIRAPHRVGHANAPGVNMTQAPASHRVPAHVPPELVREFDHHAEPVAAPDCFSPFDRLYGTRVFWSPLHGGFWVLTRARDIS